ncbi:MAG: ester cyclase [Thermoplasmata archaeon]
MRKIGRACSFLIPVIALSAIAAFMSGCDQKTAGSEENEALVRRVFEEVWNQGKLDVIDELVATDYVLHDPATPGISGRDGYRQFVTIYRTAFPDLKFTVVDQISEGDKVATRWTSTGTHKGDLMGIPPTGKQTTSTGIVISRIVDGKGVEDWSIWDAMGLLQQIGVIPPMEQGGG